jgi:hypothetical protein
MDSDLKNKNKLNKRKYDGDVYRTRLEMKEAYNKSWLPYPFGAIWNLDYCWNIIKSYYKNGFLFCIPMTLVASYGLNPKARLDGVGKRPFAYYVSVYFLVYFLMTSYFLIDSLLFCDYCKPWSYVYDETNRTEKYKELLKSKIKSEQSSIDIQNKRAQYKGLKDEEI